MWRRFNQEETPEWDEEKEDYTNRELELLADALLKEDARSEICRECGTSGSKNDNIRIVLQYNDSGDPLIDDAGIQLAIEFPEIECRNGHTWYQGEGKARGIDGDNPILFEEHLQSRRRREIFPVNGVPDPSIVAGIYNRTHPQGRKVNSDEQRKKNGASWYR